MNDGRYSKAAVHLLVVCTANVARSPLAAALLRAQIGAPDVTVTSAGTHARDGDPAADGARALAVERGLDLSSHRSQPVTAGAIADADLVLTATEEHRDHCGGLAPGAGPRTFTLQEFARLLQETPFEQGPVRIADRLLWLRSQAHYARPRSVRPREPEDIADPVRGGEQVWRRLGDTLDDLTQRIRHAVQLSDGSAS